MYKNTIIPQFSDLDGLRHVNNNIIGRWFEFGRNELFKFFTPNLEVNHKTWKLIMLKSEYDFLDQIYYGQDVEILTYILHIGNTSFIIGNEAWQDGKLKAKGKAVIVHYDYIEECKMPIPEDIKNELSKHLIKEEDIGKIYKANVE
ncbi:acyl-CoA thioesterase [Methanobrevibacter olleyae]|uniref:Acyl-CoA thioester hydrolase n=1 Tax=Methanobrevibacter olleyae TaxID=294671 RepID=A0A126QZW2_METOL|nr:thioesterase family protein [Methanobrevibacter olleyae]AMK15364.1 thioesterase family protein [Methanobrevibacter olleyae]SFL70275.1 acyl-CoA thioester hydrolase [Methanobrevibacter olleyae]